MTTQRKSPISTTSSHTRTTNKSIMMRWLSPSFQAFKEKSRGAMSKRQHSDNDDDANKNVPKVLTMPCIVTEPTKTSVDTSVDTGVSFKQSSSSLSSAMSSSSNRRSTATRKVRFAIDDDDSSISMRHRHDEEETCCLSSNDDEHREEVVNHNRLERVSERRFPWVCRVRSHSRCLLTFFHFCSVIAPNRTRRWERRQRGQ